MHVRRFRWETICAHATVLHGRSSPCWSSRSAAVVVKFVREPAPLELLEDGASRFFGARVIRLVEYGHSPGPGVRLNLRVCEADDDLYRGRLVPVRHGSQSDRTVCPYFLIDDLTRTAERRSSQHNPVLHAGWHGLCNDAR
jgi:hypothetical protein